MTPLGLDTGAGAGKSTEVPRTYPPESSLPTDPANRPCQAINPGPLIVYTQHLRYIDTIGDDRCPREEMLSKLLSLIQTWREEGDQIVLIMDCNTDI